jgi:hypothetical protein
MSLQKKDGCAFLSFFFFKLAFLILETIPFYHFIFHDL